ncbi:MAG: NIPSNAP family protein [Alphaproteobacteria bacterium]|nr:NIPSNAP family protein [Alphaproteobacteria bacterium]
MIVEERIYTLHIGKQGEYLSLYEKEGMTVQKRILGMMVGYYTTEAGPLNQVIHLWGYESFEDRLRRRKELFANPEWMAYIAKIRPLIVTQESKILIPAPFFTPKG